MNKKLMLFLTCSVMPWCYAMENESERIQLKKIDVGVVSCQNKRKEQEDRYYHGAVDGGEWCAVYDGHGGDKVAHVLTETLHDYFIQTSGTMHDRMIRSFKAADSNQYVTLQQHHTIGSTASVVYIKNHIAYFAHVGDSRVLLEKDGKVAFVTRDHKPDNEIERIKAASAIDYIKKNGNSSRLNSSCFSYSLAISRAIGDHAWDKDVVIAEPEYMEIVLTQEHKFLIIASDGLWDVVTNESALAMVTQGLEDNKSLDDIARNLQDAAIAGGSNDNITVCVVKFDW